MRNNFDIAPMAAVAFRLRVREMETLEDRLRWVMEHRKWSMSKWSIKAGFSERSTLEKALKRMRDNPNASMSVDTLVKLANAAAVSVEWLATGKGERFAAPNVEADALYPTRALAIAGARIYLYEDVAIERVLAVDDLRTDPGLDYWIHLLKAEHEAARAQKSRPTSDHDG